MTDPRQGQCVKCRRRMRNVCLNYVAGPACYGCCNCKSQADHEAESKAMAENDFRKQCRTDDAKGVVCSTAKCIRHCGHATWEEHYADAQRHTGKAKATRHAIGATTSGPTAPLAGLIVPPAPTVTASAPIAAAAAAPVARPAHPRTLWIPPALTYEFPFAFALAALAEDKHLLLYGPPGTGKTSLGHRLVKEYTQKEPIHFTPTEDTSETAVTSSWSIKAMSFEMRLGICAQAWTEDRGVVMNEVNRTNGTVHTALYNALDDREIAQMTLVDGSSIVPAGKFCFIATMNGDPLELPDALRDRFHIVHEVKSPSREQYALLGPLYGPLCKADYDTNNTDLIARRSYRRYKTMSDLEAAGVVNAGNRKQALGMVFPVTEVQVLDDAIRLKART